MKGSLRIVLATLATILLAHSACAQGQAAATLAAPRITTVTPGNTDAVIGFAPPPVVGSLPIREYVVSCDQLGNPTAGTIEVTADIQGLEGNRIPVQGLQNGQQYICTMVARAVTGGVLPRAVNSEPSNPTPAFTPSATSTGTNTIFISPPTAEQPATPPPPAPIPAPVAPVQAAPVTPPPTPAAPTLPEAPIVTDVVVGNDDVTISFTPLLAAAGVAPINGYTASCSSNSGVQASNTNPAGPTPVRVAADATKITIEGLTTGEYTCAIAADTASGTGRATMQVVTIRAEPAPEATIDPEPAMPVQNAPMVVPAAPVPAPVQVPAPTQATPPPAPVSSAMRAAASAAFGVVLAVAFMA